LIYVTPMGEARRRVSAALPIVRENLGDGTGDVYLLSAGRLETLGRWLGGFHPLSLVELDYGGLVHLLDDRTLRADESVGEMAVALAGLERGEAELTVAMYKRLLARWRPARALEAANQNKFPESLRDTTIRAATITQRAPLSVAQARRPAAAGMFARNYRQELACCAEWWQGYTL